MAWARIQLCRLSWKGGMSPRIVIRVRALGRRPRPPLLSRGMKVCGTPGEQPAIAVRVVVCVLNRSTGVLVGEVPGPEDLTRLEPGVSVDDLEVGAEESELGRPLVTVGAEEGDGVVPARNDPRQTLGGKDGTVFLNHSSTVRVASLLTVISPFASTSWTPWALNMAPTNCTASLQVLIGMPNG